MSGAGFNGARLREAREARELTGVALASLVGQAPSTISEYERGNVVPSPDAVDRLAGALNLPVTFFMRPSPLAASDRLTFRSRSAAAKTLRMRETRKFHWTVEVAAFLRDLVRYPDVSFPQWQVPEDPRVLDDQQIDDLALQLRRYWGLDDGPVPNVVELLENNGAVIVRRELGSEYIDAYSDWQYGVPHIVLGSDKLAAVRSRYDAAHELGHLVLHRQVPSELMNQAAMLKELERQAHFFAGSFLLPAETFGSDYIMPTLDSLLRLKPSWRVSVGVMIKRLAWLGFISSEKERLLWIARSRRGWTRREPHDDELLAEEPRLLRSALEALFGSARLTVGTLRVALPYSISDIEYLVGLPPDYLSELGRPSFRDEDDGRVIRFPN